MKTPVLALLLASLGLPAWIHAHDGQTPTPVAPSAPPVTVSRLIDDRIAADEAAVRDADERMAQAIAAKSRDQTLAFYDAEAVTAGSAMFRASGLAEFRENWTRLSPLRHGATKHGTDKTHNLKRTTPPALRASCLPADVSRHSP